MLNFDIPSQQISGDDEPSIIFLLNMLKTEKPLIYEIGSWTGASTSIFAKYVKPLGGKVISIDNFSGEGSQLKDYINNNNIKEILSSNLKEQGLLDFVEITGKSSDDAFICYEDETADLIFVDGNHMYDQSKRDLDNWLPKLKNGGIMCGHDFAGFDYEEDFINLDAHGNRHHGVVKSVTEKFPDVKKQGCRIWWIVK